MLIPAANIKESRRGIDDPVLYPTGLYLFGWLPFKGNVRRLSASGLSTGASKHLGKRARLLECLGCHGRDKDKCGENKTCFAISLLGRIQKAVHRFLPVAIARQTPDAASSLPAQPGLQDARFRRPVAPPWQK